MPSCYAHRMTTPDFHLVQRMTRRDRPRKKGLDALFELDYMGSAEFEYFSFAAALRELRSQTVDLTEATIQAPEGPVRIFIVSADPTGLPEAIEAWVQAGEPGQDPSMFCAAREGKDYGGDAWWAINSGFAWAIDREIADDLLTGMRGA